MHTYSLISPFMFFFSFKARPPGIYKQDYINELFRRYGDPNDALSAPSLPDWCNGNKIYN